jgi:hypothetical protein
MEDSKDDQVKALMILYTCAIIDLLHSGDFDAVTAHAQTLVKIMNPDDVREFVKNLTDEFRGILTQGMHS